MLITETMQEEEVAYLLCRGDGDDGEALASRHYLLSSAPSSAFLCFCVHQLLSFSSSFWNDEGTKKMMKTLAGFILTDFWVFPLSAGTKTISRIILISVCAALLFSPSLYVLFFCCFRFMLCFFLFYLLLMPCFS